MVIISCGLAAEERRRDEALDLPLRGIVLSLRNGSRRLPPGYSTVTQNNFLSTKTSHPLPYPSSGTEPIVDTYACRKGIHTPDQKSTLGLNIGLLLFYKNASRLGHRWLNVTPSYARPSRSHRSPKIFLLFSFFYHGKNTLVPELR
jgi:hypothetical protein